MQHVQHSNDSSQDTHIPAQTSTRPVNNTVQLAASQPQPNCDATLAAELSPWITCATMLAKVAASVAAQSCCQDLQYGIDQGTQHGSESSESLRQEALQDSQKALQDSQAKEALTKVGGRPGHTANMLSIAVWHSEKVIDLTVALCIDGTQQRQHLQALASCCCENGSQLQHSVAQMLS